MFATSTLQTFDLIFGHVDEKTQIRRITPKADCGVSIRRVNRDRESGVPCANSKNIILSRAFPASLSSCTKGSAKRVESSNTASDEREKVSHF
jgi:hypothetical protein